MCVAQEIKRRVGSPGYIAPEAQPQNYEQTFRVWLGNGELMSFGHWGTRFFGLLLPDCLKKPRENLAVEVV